MSIRDEEIADFEIGDIIYECDGGVNIETRVLSKPIAKIWNDGGVERRQWEWEAENTQDGRKIAYLLTEGLSHYGPRLYRQPQYITLDADGDWSCKLLGQTA